MTLLRLILVSGIFSSSVLAQSLLLRLDGETSIQAALGGTLGVTIAGPPDTAAVVAIDIDPGPTLVGPVSLPLGLTPAIVVVPAELSSSGEWSNELTVPNIAGLDGVDFHFVAVQADASLPGGLAISNAADLELVAPTTFSRTDLAGTLLSASPYMTHVRTFNANDAIHVGLETSQQRYLVGKTTDVYFVAAKSEAEWTADPTLVDVSNDGVDSFRFSSADIIENMFVVEPSGNAPAGNEAFGRGFDIVIDVDRDGLLGPGDVLDGGDGVAGCYVAKDITTSGPHGVVETTYGAGFSQQNLFYPADIATMTDVPLVVVSHGNGHNFAWYDHIGNHLASYGYVVMSHANNTMPGVLAAAATTISNTNTFIGNMSTVAGGALDGRVDTSNMTWIGHSRGGEGITIAYNQLVNGTSNPSNFSVNDVKLLSSIAPTTFMNATTSNPHSVRYHLWVGSADADVTGCPDFGSAPLSFPLLTRAQGQKQSTVVQGAGHGVFHNNAPAGTVANGPCQVTRSETHDIMRGYLLALVEYHIREHPGAKDFLTRQWETFRPIGAPTSSCAVVNLSFREAPGTPGVRMVDNFQGQPGIATASSGAAVTFDVAAAAEGRMADNNDVFTQSSGEPFNGFTQTFGGFAQDNPRGLVFSFAAASRYVNFELVPAQRDVRNFRFLSLRAAQGPRHPRTNKLFGPAFFAVRLKDGAGNTGTVRTDAYGMGIAAPYSRVGCGSGTGWAAEFETVRIPLRDFLAGGRDLDFGDLTSVTLLFGSDHGSEQGRLAIDDVMFVTD